VKALLAWLDDLIKQSGGSGRSSTKALWLYAGWGIVSAALTATLGGVAAYLFEATVTFTAGPLSISLVSRGRADAVYWAGIAALWTTGLGFIAGAKKHQVTATKEIVVAGKGGGE